MASKARKSAVAKKAVAKTTTKRRVAPKKTTTPKTKGGVPTKKRAPGKKPATKRPAANEAPRPARKIATSVPFARPSERSMAGCTLLPHAERALDDLERSAMAKVAAKARALVGAARTPEQIVARIASFVDDVRCGATPPPRDRDELFGLGVLWGEQLRAQVGWLWVHLSYEYEDGLSSFALVPDDRAFAVFPIDRVIELLGPDASKTATNTLAGRFAAIRDEQLPQRKPNGYLVIG